MEDKHPFDQSTGHSDFDWTVSKRNVITYTKEKRAELDVMYGDSITTINENEIVSGKVVGITSSDVVLSVGFKSDGLVPLSEFRDVEDLAIGQEYEVYVMSKEDKKGHLILSRKNAKLKKAWDQIVEANALNTIVTGLVTSKTKGGLIANVFGLETFLPGSQIDVKPITDYDQYVGKTMDLKVVKINEVIKNAVVSHKAIIEADLEGQRAAIIGQLEKGQVLEGVVKNITDFGAFMDLGGIDGLLYITDISWGRITHPNEVLKVNEKINVVVLGFDDEKKRISLGLKQLTPHPWEALPEGIEVGSTVTGKIANVEDYGAFLEVAPGVEGLIHISEVSWSSQGINSRDFFKVGATHEAKVMTIDKEDRKMSLSLKQLQEDPWIKVIDTFTPGSKLSGLVKNITPYGVFVELSEGVGGMVHISDLSWTKRFGHPSEFCKVGETLEVVMLDLDKETRKMSLGHKQIEEDPWDTFENVFPVGSVHEATVTKSEDKGAEVMLPYGLEAFAPARHAKKADGGNVKTDEKLPFKILEFDRNDKRIIVSHTRIWEEEKNEEKKAEFNERKEENEKTKKTITKLKETTEKSTLGDNDVLAQLKEKMVAKDVENFTKKAGKKEAAPKADAPVVEETPVVVAPIVEETPVAPVVAEEPKTDE
jgi:small subunit ribosomal protein S1